MIFSFTDVLLDANIANNSTFQCLTQILNILLMSITIFQTIQLICRTSRIIMLLPTLPSNCNIYCIHCLKCSVNPVPDESCSSQSSVCLSMIVSGTENSGTCSGAGSGVLCGSVLSFAPAIAFSENCSHFLSRPTDLQAWRRDFSVHLTSAGPGHACWLCSRTWKIGQYQTCGKCTRSDRNLPTEGRHRAPAVSVKKPPFTSTGSRKGPTTFVQKQEDEKQAGNRRDRQEGLSNGLMPVIFQTSFGYSV